MDKARHLRTKIEQLLAMFPVVALIGSRQCGKSTLVKQVHPDWKYQQPLRHCDQQRQTGRILTNKIRPDTRALFVSPFIRPKLTPLLD